MNRITLSLALGAAGALANGCLLVDAPPEGDPAGAEGSSAEPRPESPSRPPRSDGGASGGSCDQAVADYALASSPVCGLGFDFTGDGQPDNALGNAPASLWSQIFGAPSATRAWTRLAAQGDALPVSGPVHVGLAPAVAVADGVLLSPYLEGGKQVGATSAELSEGAFHAVLGSGAVVVGGTVLSPRAAQIGGRLEGGGLSGMIGLAIDKEQLAELATERGVDAETVAWLEGLADVDSDGDGHADAVSAAMTFIGEPAQVANPPAGEPIVHRGIIVINGKPLPPPVGPGGPSEDPTVPVCEEEFYISAWSSKLIASCGGFFGSEADESLCSEAKASAEAEAQAVQCPPFCPDKTVSLFGYGSDCDDYFPPRPQEPYGVAVCNWVAKVLCSP